MVLSPGGLSMARIRILLGISLALLVFGAQQPHPQQPDTAQSAISNAPQYTADARLKFPANYREWVFLSSGIDMSYGPLSGMNHSMFDNVFVNPESYKAFLATGTWPDRTMLVLE